MHQGHAAIASQYWSQALSLIAVSGIDLCIELQKLGCLCFGGLAKSVHLVISVRITTKRTEVTIVAIG